MSTEPASIQRVGILFSGGPAPSANAVISSAVSAFHRSGRQVVGFLHGYAGLQEYDPQARPLVEGQDYRFFKNTDLRGLRNSRGVCIGTARANPGKGIRGPADLADPQRTQRLAQVYAALRDLQIDALISIGGDDTLKTANFLHSFQDSLPAGSHRVRIVHLPKTIDNDYQGIDFTFGYFTAVDFMAKEVLNLRADAMATNGYFIIECMGRKAGWLSYGVAIAGEAHMVVGVEDVTGDLRIPGAADTDPGHLDLDALADRVVDLVLTREGSGRKYGTVVLAEGLAELLPPETLAGLPRDEHGHISLGKLDIGKLVADRATRRFEARTGRTKKFKGVQLGYEARCTLPHAFDVMLGCQLGRGAFRALVEEGLDGHMVSITGQLDLRYVPFAALVDPETLVTEVRFIADNSDFHQLAHGLGTQVKRADDR